MTGCATTRDRHGPPRQHCRCTALVRTTTFQATTHPIHSLLRPPIRSGMASRVTVKQLKEELKRRGLPIYGSKSDLLERCRVHGVSCVGPGESAVGPVAMRHQGDRVGAPSSPAVADVAQRGDCVAGADDADCEEAAGQAADTRTASHATMEPPAGPPAGTPRAVTAAGDSPAAPEERPDSAVVGGSRTRAPPFSKHENARLAHVLCTGEVAAGVVVSRGPMSRRQQDARARRGSVWVVVVAEMFNGTDRFSIPADCADGGLDPNVHPHVRTGLFLKAKWSEVGEPLRFLFACSLRTIFCTRHLLTMRMLGALDNQY